jgi:hypothetical protein
MTIDKTDQGDQLVIPGAERISDRELARRKMAGALKPSRSQAALDFGLFGAEADQPALPLPKP